MPPAVSHSTMPNRSPGDTTEESPSAINKGRKFSEKTEEEEILPTSTKKKIGRPKSRPKNSDEDRADVDNEPAHFQDFDEDDSDDDNRATGSKKNRKYYIVKNEKNGRPTEVFRTDRLHALRMGTFNKEDSDDEYCGPNNGMIKLHDRWREEWNYGIQVPVNCNNLPVFEIASNDLKPVETEPFQLPLKYIGIRPQSSHDARHPISPTKYVKPSTHNIEELPQRLLYNGDRLDEIWLEKLNKTREHSGTAPMTMKQFLRIMNALEIQCYVKLHEQLLAPLHTNPTPGSQEDDACDVCGSVDHDEGDDMLYCDNCNTCFHLSCYGLEELPKEGVWNCQRCLLCGDNIPPCIMCPTIGGALKLTEPLSDGQPRWCHVGCALWIPECKFADPDAREKVIDIDAIPDERWHMKCAICDTRKGACIQCSVSNCKTAFHVACATRSGYEMRIEPSTDNPDSDLIHMIALCNKHRTMKTEALKTGETSDSKSKLSSDEEVDEKENPFLKNLESRFYMYIDEDAIAHQLKEDRLSVSDVYEYWKLKRHQLCGKPLIRSAQDEILSSISGNSFAGPSNDGSMIARLGAVTTKIKHLYDKSRNLAWLLTQREKAKLEIINTDISITRNIWDQLLSQVPMSDRVIAQIVATLKSTMTQASIQNIEENEEELLEVETTVCSSRSSTIDSSERPITRKILKTPTSERSKSRKTVTIKPEFNDDWDEMTASSSKRSPLKSPNRTQRSQRRLEEKILTSSPRKITKTVEHQSPERFESVERKTSSRNHRNTRNATERHSEEYFPIHSDEFPRRSRNMVESHIEDRPTPKSKRFARSEKISSPKKSPKEVSMSFSPEESHVIFKPSDTSKSSDSISRRTRSSNSQNESTPIPEEEITATSRKTRRSQGILSPPLEDDKALFSAFRRSRTNTMSSETTIPSEEPTIGKTRGLLATSSRRSRLRSNSGSISTAEEKRKTIPKKKMLIGSDKIEDPLRKARSFNLSRQQTELVALSKRIRNDASFSDDGILVEEQMSSDSSLLSPSASLRRKPSRNSSPIASKSTKHQRLSLIKDTFPNDRYIKAARTPRSKTTITTLKREQSNEIPSPSKKISPRKAAAKRPLPKNNHKNARRAESDNESDTTSESIASSEDIYEPPKSNLMIRPKVGVKNLTKILKDSTDDDASSVESQPEPSWKKQARNSAGKFIRETSPELDANSHLRPIKRIGQRYRSLPQAEKEGDRRITRSIRPAQLGLEGSPQPPAAKKGKIDIQEEPFLPKRNSKSVKQELMDMFSDSPPLLTPITSRVLKVEDFSSASTSSPPTLQTEHRKNFVRQPSELSSEASVEIGEHYQRPVKNLISPPRLSPRRNFSSIPEFVNTLYKDDPQLIDFRASLSPSPRRSSPFKESNSTTSSFVHPVSQRTRHRGSISHLREPRFSL